MTNELAFIAGPALVSVLVLVTPPSGIVAGAGAAVLLGLLLLLIGPAVRDVTPSPAGPSTRTPLARIAGPLFHGPTALVLLVAAADTFVFGCLRIGTVAATDAAGAIGYAAVLAGLISVGALIGALVYGARSARSTAHAPADRLRGGRRSPPRRSCRGSRAPRRLARRRGRRACARPRRPPCLRGTPPRRSAPKRSPG
jgi:hypothetical protein